MKQITKDMICVGMLALAAFGYEQSLLFYLSALQHPWLLLYAFWGSLLLALLHVVSVRAVRISLLRSAALTISFCIAVWVAHEIRGLYLGALVDVATFPGMADYISPDYYGAITNKVVGYGGCFAVGLLFVRWLVVERAEHLLRWIFASEAYSPAICEHCRQPIYG